MTAPSNGGGRIVDHVAGVVASSNERGCKLVGEDGYRNFSKYVESPIAAPARGSSIRLGLDASGFVRELQVMDAAASSAPSPSRDRTIARLAVLKAASHFLGLMGQAHPEVRSEHVLVLADKWLRWVETDDREEGEPF